MHFVDAAIGELMEFQEPSAFRRAFKAWSGVQPDEYRRRQVQGMPVGSIERSE